MESRLQSILLKLVGALEVELTGAKETLSGFPPLEVTMSTAQSLVSMHRALRPLPTLQQQSVPSPGERPCISTDSPVEHKMAFAALKVASMLLGTLRVLRVYLSDEELDEPPPDASALLAISSAVSRSMQAFSASRVAPSPSPSPSPLSILSLSDHSGDSSLSPSPRRSSPRSSVSKSRRHRSSSDKSVVSHLSLTYLLHMPPEIQSLATTSPSPPHPLSSSSSTTTAATTTSPIPHSSSPIPSPSPSPPLPQCPTPALFHPLSSSNSNSQIDSSSEDPSAPAPPSSSGLIHSPRQLIALSSTPPPPSSLHSSSPMRMGSKTKIITRGYQKRVSSVDYRLHCQKTDSGDPPLS